MPQTRIKAHAQRIHGVQKMVAESTQNRKDGAKTKATKKKIVEGVAAQLAKKKAEDEKKKKAKAKAKSTASPAGKAKLKAKIAPKPAAKKPAAKAPAKPPVKVKAKAVAPAPKKPAASKSAPAATKAAVKGKAKVTAPKPQPKGKAKPAGKAGSPKVKTPAKAAVKHPVKTTAKTAPTKAKTAASGSTRAKAPQGKQIKHPVAATGKAKNASKPQANVRVRKPAAVTFTEVSIPDLVTSQTKGKAQPGGPAKAKPSKPKAKITTPAAPAQIKAATKGTKSAPAKPHAVAGNAKGTPGEAPKKTRVRLNINRPLDAQDKPVTDLNLTTTKRGKTKKRAVIDLTGDSAEYKEKRHAVFVQHHQNVQRKRAIQARLSAAKMAGDTEAHAKYKQQLNAFKPYTDKIVRKLDAKLLESFEPIVRGEARAWCRKLGVSESFDPVHGHATGFLADLLQEGRMQAWKVIRSHSSDLKTDLENHVRGAVKQGLFRAWRRLLGRDALKISHADNAHLAQWSAVKGHLSRELGREPSHDEVATAMGTEAKRVRELEEMAQKLVARSIDATVGNDEGDESTTYGDFLASEGADPAEQPDADYGEKLHSAVHAALRSIKDPRARYVLMLDHGIEDGGKTLNDLIAHQRLPELSKYLKQAEHTLKTTAIAGKTVNGKKVTSLSDDAIVRGALALSGLRTINPNGQPYKLAMNVLKWKHDYQAMLTTPKELKDGTAKTWIAPHDLVTRLGYNPDSAAKFRAEAKRAFQLHSQVQRFHEDEMQKSWTLQIAWTPELRLYREAMCGDQPYAPPTKLVKGWLADSSLIKSLGQAENVWTVVDPLNDLVWQYGVFDLDDQLAKGYGSDLEKQHPGGHWVTMHGRHVFIDKDGKIVGGPAGMVGKHIDELKGDGGKEHAEGEHTHADQEDQVKNHKHVISHGGKTLHIHAHHEHVKKEGEKLRSGLNGMAGKTETKIHKITDENGNPMLKYVDGKGVTRYTTDREKAEREAAVKEKGKGKGQKQIEETQDVKGVFAHLGVDLNARVEDMLTEDQMAGMTKAERERQLINPTYAADLHRTLMSTHDPEKMAAQLAGYVKGYKDRQLNSIVNGQISDKLKGEAKAEDKAKKKDVDWAATAEHEGGGKTFSATMHGGKVVNIETDGDGRVKGSYWGALLDGAVIQNESDLSEALDKLKGTTSVVHLSNGSGHWLVNVEYDGKGSPVITSGPLAGKRLHEVLGADGKLQHYAKPAVFNGKVLHAGYDSKKDKLTALGNWSKEKAYDYFGAHSDEDKAEVDRVLAESDKHAVPDVATVTLEPKQKGQLDKDRRAILALPNNPDEVVLADAIQRLGLGNKKDLTVKQRQDILSAIADPTALSENRFSTPDKLKEKYPILNLSEDEQTRMIAHAHKLSKLIHAMREEGHGAIVDTKGGKKALMIPVAAVDSAVQHIGGAKLRGDMMARLQLHRQRLAQMADAINGFDELAHPVYGPDGKAQNAIPNMRTHMLKDDGSDGPRIGFTKHQEKMIHHYVTTGRTISALGVGNGKTSSALAAAEYAREHNPDTAPKKQLIVVPSNAQAKAWRDDARKFFGFEHGKEITSGKNIGADARYHVVTRAMLANPKTKVGGKTVRAIAKDHGVTIEQAKLDPKVFAKLQASHPELTMHDLEKPSRKIGAKPLAQHLQEQGFDGVIVDEAHTVNSKNEKGGAMRKALDAYINGQRHDAVGLPDSSPVKGVMALTATPIQNDLAEMHNLVNMTHRGIHDLGTQKQFMKKYAEKDPATGFVTGIKDEHVEGLGNTLANYMVASSAEDLNQEMRPPSALVQQHEIELTHPDHVAMVKAHNDALHSSGAMAEIEGDQGNLKAKRKGGGALAAISKAETDLHAIKRPHVEALMRKILADDPHAKIILASKRIEGQKMLHEVASSVLGEYTPDKTKAHYQAALDRVEKEIGEETQSHNQLKADLEKEHGETKAGHDRYHELRTKEDRTEAETAEMKQHKDHADRHGLLSERLEAFPHEANTVKALNNVKADILSKLGGQMAERLGYQHGMITADANTDQRNAAVDSFNQDESHKALVVSANIAASGVNLGRGTHIIDLDGDYNQANLEQLYGRHARLTGSVPKAEVHQIVTKCAEAGVPTMDEHKYNAAGRKRGISDQVRQTARKGKPVAPGEHVRIKPKEFGVEKEHNPEITHTEPEQDQAPLVTSQESDGQEDQHAHAA